MKGGGGKLNSVTGSVDNTDQINVFDLVKNNRFLCVINDTSGSDAGPANILLGELAFFMPCVIHNKKKGTGVSITYDIMNNGFKGFPVYGMFDYDFPNALGGEEALGPIVNRLVQNHPEDGYYITKDEFLKVWNEATLL